MWQVDKKNHLDKLVIIVIITIGLSLFSPTIVFAQDGTVGTGTAISCDESELRAEIGSVFSTITFNCPTNHTINLTSSSITINSNKTLDGTGQSVTINHNDAFRIFHQTGGSFTIQNLTLTNGDATTGDGGAILVEGTSTLNVYTTTFSNNTARYGGAIEVNDSNANVLIEDSTFNLNTSTSGSDPGGGAIRVNSANTVTINDTTFDTNTANRRGGGISVSGGTVNINRSAFIDNQTTNSTGAGLFVDNGITNIYNSTFSGNTSASTGGGISVENGTVVVRNSTIVDNTATNGGGTRIFGSGSIDFQNSIVANNSPNNCANNSNDTDSGGNFSDDTDCSTFDSTFNVGTDLDSLTGTPAYYPLDLDESNPAFNGGTFATCPSTDQRGVNRSSSPCDAGAYEIIQVTIGNATAVNEGNNASFPVTLSSPAPEDTTINYNFTNDTATGGLDYDNTVTPLTISAGSSSGTIVVPTISDNVYDGPTAETFTVTLLSVTTGNALIVSSNSAGQGAINDLQTPPEVTINSGLSKNEGDSGTTSFVFTVTMSTELETPVVVTYSTADNTATIANNDYQSVTDGEVTIPAYTTSANFTINVNGDTTEEPNETFFVNLTAIYDSNGWSSLGTPTQSTATIINDDTTPTLNISGPATVAEGDSGTTNASYTVSLDSTNTQDVTFDYTTSNGTATAGSDYTATSGSETILAGNTSVTIDVPILGDTLDEPDETFQISINNINNANGGTTNVTTTILDDDASPNLTVSSISIVEGNSGTNNALFLVTTDIIGSQAISFKYTTTDGTATAGADYTASSGNKTINTSSNFTTIEIPIIGDTIDENNEIFYIILSDITNATATVTQTAATIIDDDTATLSINDVLELEGSTGLSDTLYSFEVMLSTTSDRVVTVDYATEDGSAISNSDFIPINGTLVFTPGEQTKLITVSVWADLIDEGDDESFFVNLSNATNASISDSQGRGRIFDDDFGSGISVADITVIEGEIATFEVALSNISALPVTVDYEVTAGTANDGIDYLAQTGTITIVPNTLTATINITTILDTLYEADETFFVTLSNPTGGLISKAQGIAIIKDATGKPSLAITSQTVVEGTNDTAILTVALSTDSSVEISVEYNTTADTAIADEDYIATNGQLIFTPGEIEKQIIVPIINDAVREPIQQFTVVLRNETNAVLDNAEGVITIEDDDDMPTLLLNNTQFVEGDDVNSGNMIVKLSAPTYFTATVQYQSIPDSAKAGTDYQSISGTLIFLPGINSQIIPITILGDLIAESDETFTIQFSDPTEMIIETDQTQITILNDDVPQLAISDMVTFEGNDSTHDAIFTLTLSLMADYPVVVTYTTANGNATASEEGVAIQNPDYMSASGQLTFSPGITLQQLGITILGDKRFEDDENFFVNLLTVKGANFVDNQGEGIILNDDLPEGQLPTVSILDTSIIEGDGGLSSSIFTVTIAPSANYSITLNYLIQDDTATMGVDYQALNTTHTLTISALSTYQTITVPIIGDKIGETDERFLINLLPSEQVVISKNIGVGTIVNDDTVQILMTDRIVREGTSHYTASFTIKLSQPSDGIVYVEYNTDDTQFSRNNNATANTDYETQTGFLIFEPGETEQTFSIPIYADNVEEGLETFVINLSNAVRAEIVQSQAVVTILDQDTLPSFYINDVTVNEGENAVFTVYLWPVPNSSVTVDYTTQDGSAIANEGDYVAQSGILTFNTTNLEQVVTIPIPGDQLTEVDETFEIILSNPVGAILSEKYQGQATIVDAQDALPTLSLHGPTEIVEGMAGTSQTVVVTVTLSSASDETVTVNYTTNDSRNTATANEDYTTALGRLTFTPGQTIQTINITIHGDDQIEGNEQLYLNLSNVNEAATIANGQLQLTIIDNDGGNKVTVVYLPALTKQPVPVVTVTPTKTPTMTPTPTSTLPPNAKPDLVIETIQVDNNNVELVIRNLGGTVTTAQSFWVDLYINPDPPPSAVNQLWPGLSNQGITWRITEPALPLDLNETITLRYSLDSGATNLYYVDDLSNFTGNLSTGTSIYAQVDSNNLTSNYGVVLETHEENDGLYNNITGPVLSEGGATPTPTATATPIQAPDLIIEQVSVGSDKHVELVLHNQGNIPVTEPFWVDLYVNPKNPPTQVNQDWYTHAQADGGVVWFVKDVIINPNGQLVLQYSPDPTAPNEFVDPSARTNLPDTINPDTPIYAQVDSFNLETTYGNILELHEIEEQHYNNIIGPIGSTEMVELNHSVIIQRINPSQAPNVPSRP